MNVTDKIRPWINEAIIKTGTTGVVWESGLYPDPNTGSVGIGVVFWTRGVQLGTVMQGSFLIQDPVMATEMEVVNEAVDFLTQFMAAKAEQEAKMAPQTPGQTASGLIIP